MKYHNLSKPDRIKAVIDNKVGKITKKEIMELCPDISKVTVEMCIRDRENSNVINVDLKGDDMGVLIGKRGQTLDSLQYLTNLAVKDVYKRQRSNSCSNRSAETLGS